MRYANQPLSELENLPLEDLSMWVDEVAELIQLENDTGSRDNEYEYEE